MAGNTGRPLPPQIRGFRVPVNSPKQECTFTKLDCAAFYSRSHRAVIRAYDDAGNVLVCLDQIASVIPRCSLANAAVGEVAIKSVIFTPP
jgi:hypothetical protein